MLKKSKVCGNIDDLATIWHSYNHYDSNDILNSIITLELLQYHCNMQGMG